jgi:hypothetical protein
MGKKPDKRKKPKAINDIKKNDELYFYDKSFSTVDNAEYKVKKVTATTIEGEVKYPSGGKAKFKFTKIGLPEHIDILEAD